MTLSSEKDHGISERQVGTGHGSHGKEGTHQDGKTDSSFDSTIQTSDSGSNHAGLSVNEIQSWWLYGMLGNDCDCDCGPRKKKQK